VIEPSGPQVSWKAIESDAAVVSAEGAELAQVVEIAGDRTADIFNGLVILFGPLDRKRYVPAERVTGIWPRRVQVDLTASELDVLRPYDEPVVERLLPMAQSGGDDLLRRYCAELEIEPEPRVLEALVFAYWLEYTAYQLRAHLDRRSQPTWIEGNIELVAHAAERFTKRGPGDRAPSTPTA